ncbi:MAG TPA: type IV-A pilus assembly ATPase PilB [Pseudomonadaceae bacterium]|nr:type IV-A pilus assembly ATPase PilB [Pseudomonadaceae bacterium]
MNTDAHITGLARRLVSEQLLDHAAAVAACSTASSEGTPLVRHLVRKRLVTSKSIAKVAAREFGLPLLGLSAIDPATLPLSLVDARLLHKHNVLPLRRQGQRLILGVSDPSDSVALNEIKFHTGLAVDQVVVEEDALGSTLDQMLQPAEKPGDARFADLGALALDEPGSRRPADTMELGDGMDPTDAPVVRFVNKLLYDAVKLGASDIHLEPYEKFYRVRYRQDGILREVDRPPLSIAARIASRLKIMSSMDISERRIPQDGRITLKLPRGKTVDFRINTLPTLWGEKIVLRILDPGSAQLGIDALGYEPEQKQCYLRALHQQQGMILVTGPTGSGKTVSLYTGLNLLNTLERNISTAEDPVEINLEGINQVAVNVKVGLSFATALRAFLRQDPDVVMVGEIRDLVTAEIAIKAAQTGHLVLSTLHTNSAAETLTRLRNMGIPSYNIATSVSLIIAQRLARRLCTSCRKPVTLPRQLLRQEGFNDAHLDNAQLFEAVGCEKCEAGYKGRIGIYEVMPITDRISRIIMAEGSSMEIADTAREEGFSDLRCAALQKVAAGLTSLAEANRLI